MLGIFTFEGSSDDLAQAPSSSCHLGFVFADVFEFEHTGCHKHGVWITREISQADKRTRTLCKFRETECP